MWSLCYLNEMYELLMHIMNYGKTIPVKENNAAIEILIRASKTEDLLAAPFVFYHSVCCWSTL